MDTLHLQEVIHGNTVQDQRPQVAFLEGIQIWSTLNVDVRWRTKSMSLSFGLTIQGGFLGYKQYFTSDEPVTKQEFRASYKQQTVAAQ